MGSEEVVVWNNVSVFELRTMRGMEKKYKMKSDDDEGKIPK